jgi:hypothetical protein
MQIPDSSKYDSFESHAEALLENGHSNYTIQQKLIERGVGSHEALYIVQTVQANRVKRIEKQEAIRRIYLGIGLFILMLVLTLIGWQQHKIYILTILGLPGSIYVIGQGIKQYIYIKRKL